MKDILTYAILSIKPIYANAIMSGEKKVEFRKKNFKKNVDKVFVYSSSPEQKIIGFFTIDDVVENHPTLLWEQFKDVGGINKEAFFKYYDGYDQGVSIKINEVVSFNEKINPTDFFDKFHAPQSYLYLKEEVGDEIIKHLKL